ncbi:hypothetical protein [Parafrankia soli]|uniref:hypothetical protein n=1 Tax=Parafrankia soli TaxID=2599596 RepID=UPI000AEA793C|nr:hypothetical protein [Parafrankia soli]
MRHDHTDRGEIAGRPSAVHGHCGSVFHRYLDPLPDNVHADQSSALSRGQLQLGGALGYATVALLLVLAASWRTKALTTTRGAVAARVVADGLTASAAALSLGYGWKLALALYMPGGINENGFNTDGQFVYFMLNDFGPFIGYLGVVVAAGAVAWLSLRDRLVSRWLGLVSLIPPVAVLFMSGAVDRRLPGHRRADLADRRVRRAQPRQARDPGHRQGLARFPTGTPIRIPESPLTRKRVPGRRSRSRHGSTPPVGWQVQQAGGALVFAVRASRRWRHLGEDVRRGGQTETGSGRPGRRPGPGPCAGAVAGGLGDPSPLP